MKNVKRLLSFALVAIIFFVGFSNTMYADSDMELGQSDEMEIREKIEHLLKERASVMLSDENILCKNVFRSQKKNMTEQMQRVEIAEFRKELESVGETYSKARTIIDINEVKKDSDSRVSVNVKEETYLTIAETSVETGYAARHEFVFEKGINGEWNIIEDKQLDPTGLMPLDRAEEYVDRSSDIFEEIGKELFVCF